MLGCALRFTPYADVLFSSSEHGWRSLLLCHIVNSPEVEDMTIAPIEGQTIGLVTHGESDIESESDGRWRRSRSRPGQIAMTAPGLPTHLRWRTLSPDPSESLNLYLRAATTSRLVEEIWDNDPARMVLPDTLSTTDPVLEQAMLGLLLAARMGAPDLYAETAAEFIAAHILVRHGPLAPPALAAHDDRRIVRAKDFMWENLHRSLSLAEIAAEAELSPYHFARVFRQTTGQTPHRHLTQLRVEQGRRELATGKATIAEIAVRAGFATPSHFAAVFRRETGQTPSAYRRASLRPTK